MVSYVIWLLKLVRTEILEGLTLPELDISYWDFCIILAVVGIVATVLINSVRISGSVDKENVYDKEKQRHKQRLRARDDAKVEYNRTKNGGGSIQWDKVDDFINRD